MTLVVLVLYFVIIAAIGAYFSRVEVTHSDFTLGGGKLPAWALALSERATGSSALDLCQESGQYFLTE